jgi:uncharacterized protein
MSRDRDERFENDVTFVLIVSRLCNLRCTYCYEYPDLADRRRMSLAELGRIFEAVAAHYAGAAPLSIRFAWQGGEPLLHEPEFYRRALELQRRVFSAHRHRVVNVMQTNLTRLDDERVALLRECFDGVGVSHDVVAGLRLDAGGRARDEQTEANLDRLGREGISLGGITVLTRRNFRQVRRIYAFWRNRGLPFRLLPVHRGPAPDVGGLALSAAEVAQAYRECMDLWLTDERAPRAIAPLHDLFTGVLYKSSLGLPMPAYDKQRKESVFIIDRDGSVGGIDDLLELGHAYGNIFHASLDELLAGPGHQRAVAAASARMAKSCGQCPFFKSACNGGPVAEGGKDFSAADEGASCPARKTLAHIERRLVQLGLIDPVSGELRRALPEPQNDVAAAAAWI